MDIKEEKTPINLLQLIGDYIVNPDISLAEEINEIYREIYDKDIFADTIFNDTHNLIQTLLSEVKSNLPDISVSHKVIIICIMYKKFDRSVEVSCAYNDVLSHELKNFDPYSRAVIQSVENAFDSFKKNPDIIKPPIPNRYRQWHQEPTGTPAPPSVRVFQRQKEEKQDCTIF